MPRDGAGSPNPLFELRPLGDGPGWWSAAGWVIVGLIVVSRIVAFPHSIWEQDEAYFAAAVLKLDLLANQPHPPWFPLWIVLGKGLHLLGLAPAFGLRLAAAFLGTWVFFPLLTLYSSLLKRPLAALAAAMTLLVPGVWLLSGRAFTGGPAMAMLLLGAAVVVRKESGRWWMGLAAVALAAGVLIRPHLLLVALVVAAAGGALCYAFSLA